MNRHVQHDIVYVPYVIIHWHLDMLSHLDNAIIYDDVKITWSSGGRLNKKDGLTRYGNSHVKDKTS